MTANRVSRSRLLTLLVAVAAGSSVPSICAEVGSRPVFDVECSRRLHVEDSDGRQAPIPYNCQIEDDSEPVSATNRVTLRTPEDVKPVTRTINSQLDSHTPPRVLDRLILLWRSIRFDEQNKLRR